MRSDVDEWCRYEGQSDEENEVNHYMFNYRLLNVENSQLEHNL